MDENKIIETYFIICLINKKGQYMQTCVKEWGEIVQVGSRGARWSSSIGSIGEVSQFYNLIDDPFN